MMKWIRVRGGPEPEIIRIQGKKVFRIRIYTLVGKCPNLTVSGSATPVNDGVGPGARRTGTGNDRDPDPAKTLMTKLIKTRDTNSASIRW